MAEKVAEKPNGKLGVLIVGNGAVATTFMTSTIKFVWEEVKTKNTCTIKTSYPWLT